MNWLYYLAEANLYLCVFYLAYCLFLAKETHYQLNRVYLLLSCTAAFILPVLQVSALKGMPQVAVTLSKTAVFEPAPMVQIVATPIKSGPQQAVTTLLSYQDYLLMAYAAGTIILLLVLLVKLYSVFKLMRLGKTQYGSYKLVYLPDTNVAFSFFNYLFVGARANGASTIINHELVHIRQKHSADIIFLELLKVLCWFNPCVYLLQNSLKTIHEYIADEQTAAIENDATAYSTFLVNNAYGLGGSSITHSFFNYNLLKKRIMMLHQQRSGKLAWLKYLVALPICAGLLCASTLGFSKSYGWIELGTPKIIPVVGDTLRTSKGFIYKETIYSENDHKVLGVLFYESNGKTKGFKSSPMTKAKLNLLKQHYGYEFPEGTVPPPPPPTAPKNKKMGVVKFPPPVVKPPKPKVDQVRFPPKPKVDIVKFPPSPTGVIKTSSTGYQYEETGYLVNGKQLFRVIIHEKDGNEIPFFSNRVTKKQKDLLAKKYGYTFPDIKIYDKLPPPPPMAPGAPAAEKKAAISSVKLQGGLVINDKPPIMVVNDIPYVYSSQQLNDINKGGAVYFTASDSIVYNYDSRLIKSKWGLNADNAVALYGKSKIVVK